MADPGLRTARLRHEVVGEAWEYAAEKYEWTTNWSKGMFSKVIACANCGDCAIAVLANFVGDDGTRCGITTTASRFSTCQPWQHPAGPEPPACYAFPLLSAHPEFCKFQGRWRLCGVCNGVKKAGREHVPLAQRGDWRPEFRRVWPLPATAGSTAGANSSTVLPTGLAASGLVDYTRTLIRLDPVHAQLLSCVDATLTFRQRAYGFVGGSLTPTSLMDTPLMCTGDDGTQLCELPAELHDLAAFLYEASPVVKKFLTLGEMPCPQSGMAVLHRSYFNLRALEIARLRAPAPVGGHTNINELYATADSALRLLQGPTVPDTFRVGSLVTRDTMAELSLDVRSDGRPTMETSDSGLSLEEAAFPMLFPSGTGTRGETKTSLKDYLKYRMRNMLSPFTMYMPYVLLMFMLLRGHQLMQGVKNICLESEYDRYMKANPNARPEDAFRHLYVSKVPDTVVGSVRWQKENLLDLQAKINKHGPADFFLTFTCDEFTDTRFPEYDKLQELLNSVDPSKGIFDVPAESERAFKLKVEMFMELHIIKNEMLGKVRDYAIKYEFQDRGSVHAHILLWIAPEDVDRVANEIAAYVPGGHNLTEEEELALPEHVLRLRRLVLRKQIHTCRKEGPSACVRSGKCGAYCKRGFPFKPNREGTVLSSEGNVSKYIYLRPEQGDERVIAYHPGLLLLWGANMNLMRVTGDHMAEYLAKYFSKAEPTGSLVLNGETLASVGLLPADAPAIQKNLAAAHMQLHIFSSCEAVWHLLDFPIIKTSFTVVRVALQTPDKSCVSTPGGFIPPSVSKRDLYQVRPNGTEFASMPFTDFFTKYDVVKNWKRPRNFTGPTPALCADSTHRCVPRDPSHIVRFTEHSPQYKPEGFFFRILVHRVPFRAVAELLSPQAQNTTQTYFQECQLRGLLLTVEDLKAQIEAYLKRTFTLRTNTKNVLVALFNKYSWLAGIDVRSGPIPFPGTPMPNAQLERAARLAATDMTKTPHEELIEFAHLEGTVLNAQQQRLFDLLYDPATGGAFFVTGLAGAGKTLWAQYFMHRVRQRERVVVAGMTGQVAARASKFARTSHRTFTFPRQGMVGVNWNPSREETRLIIAARVWIIDEISMLSSHLALLFGHIVLHATNTWGSLEEALKKKLIIFVGDLCQLPPVCFHHKPMQHDPNVQFCDTCHITTSPLWAHVRKFCLTQCMRQAQGSPFLNFLNKARTEFITNDDLDVLRPRFVPRWEHMQLIDTWVANNSRDTRGFAILTSHREQADEYNNHIIDAYFSTAELHATPVVVEGGMLPVELHEWRDDTDFHRLPKVAVGMRVMVTENTDLPDGRLLPNGDQATIAAVKMDGTRVSEVKLKLHDGVEIWMDRCSRQQKRHTGNFIFVKHTFPLMPAYAVTVHKAQGETLRVPTLVDIRCAFVAGLLYVALSRVTDIDLLHIAGELTPAMFTPVPEGFNGLNDCEEL